MIVETNQRTLGGSGMCCIIWKRCRALISYKPEKRQPVKLEGTEGENYYSGQSEQHLPRRGAVASYPTSGRSGHQGRDQTARGMERA